MAKENKNVTVNAAETKEETNMAVNANVVTEQQAAPVVEQAPVAAPVVTDGTQVPAAPAEKPKFWDRPIPSKIKKVGKWVAAGGAIIGGLVIAHKLGEASGFDKATDAYNASNGSSDPEPDYNPDNDLGDSGVEEVSEES